MLEKILLVGAGGFIGSNLRYWSGVFISPLLTVSFPLATLFVNLTGSFLLGFVFFSGTEFSFLNAETRLFLGTGMMGAFTTFSTFSVESLQLLRESGYMFFLLNITANVLGGIICAFLGFLAAKALFSVSAL